VRGVKDIVTKVGPGEVKVHRVALKYGVPAADDGVGTVIANQQSDVV